jgi:hypothetical protein
MHTVIESRIYEGCRVQWRQWYGFPERPWCVERVEDGCEVEVRGSMATVRLPDGKTIRKRVTSRGFSWSSPSGEGG